MFLTATYTRQYFNFGATTVSMFYSASPNINNFSTGNSYVFSGDANGDGVSGNDLIYIPKDTSEMNFKPLTVSGKTFTAADQAAAFEQYIQNDDYLRSHRGQYAERNGFYSPLVNRVDLSIMQDIFHKIGGARHSGQLRLDITNFGNLLNHNWGVSQRLINNQILTSPSADPLTGKLLYNMQIGQRRPADDAVADQRGHLGRLRDDVELPLHVQLDSVTARIYSERPAARWPGVSFLKRLR